MARLKPVWFLAVAIACLLGATYAGYVWHRMDQLNRAILDPSTRVVDENSHPELVFAKAWQLERSGAGAEAIRLYASLQTTADKALRARVLHNLGTIYLKEGAKLWNARGVLEYARVNTLVELAKEYYRDSLRLDPDNWDARYNLEYAWHITPPPRERPKSDLRGSKSSVFSTLPGIPGGGP
ncbi:MAG TPA: MxaK protein [Methylococcaceae bacterium]|nr:MxaK protein [Methylococcaceae bacterium]